MSSGSCNNCPGTVWFNHSKKKWAHSEGGPMCTKPEPYFPDGRLRTYYVEAREALEGAMDAASQEDRSKPRRVRKPR